MNDIRRIHDDIRAYIAGLWVIDTHEHLVSEKVRLSMPTDVFGQFLRSYLPMDLTSAGCDRDTWAACMDHTRPLAERWALIEPYWTAARHTGLAMALRRTAREVYGVDRFDAEGLERIQRQMQAEATPGLHHRTLRDRCHIAVSIVGAARGDDYGDPMLYRNRMWTLPFTGLASREGLAAIEKDTGHSIHSFPELKDALDQQFQWAIHEAQPPICAVKLSQVLRGPLSIGAADRNEAERSFESVARRERDPDPIPVPGRPRRISDRRPMRSRCRTT